MTIEFGDLFLGDDLDLRTFLKASRDQRYIYILHRPDGRPFYVGQGQK